MESEFATAFDGAGMGITQRPPNAPASDGRSRRVSDATRASDTGDKRRVLRALIPADLSRVQDARRLMNQVASLAALDDRQRFDLEVAVSEACANAIEHAGREVEVVAWLLRDRIVVEISSEGGFQPKAPSDDGLHPRGMGLSLMASLADQMQVSRLTDSLTQVSLTFLVEPDAISSGGPPQPSTLLAGQFKRTILLQDPRVHGHVLTPKEMREQKQTEARLTRQAFHDHLTGLANRALFFDRIENSLHRAGRQGTSITVALIDLDEFKSVNDLLGHASGDQLLAMVGARLSDLLRAGDTAARLGGDEFGLLLGESIEPANLASAVERILTCLREPYDLFTARLPVTASIGVATSGPSARTVQELLRHADLALYASKSQGRDGWKLFEPHMRVLEQTKRESEAELRRALERDEIMAYYQPFLFTEPRRIAGLEAFTRWKHPTRGLLSPESFIDLAEETGLIVPLGYELLEQACRSLCEWDARFPDHGLQVMVNLSPRQLGEPGLVDGIVAILTASGVAPGRLVLKIAEDVLADDRLGVLETLAALRETGIRMAIDNFGTGYSSLNRLKEYPIDILKMARPFVEAISDTDEGVSVAAAVVSLARSLGMQVVAEGVEEYEQLEKLHSIGCDMWQGEFFSAPVPPSTASALLERHAGG